MHTGRLWKSPLSGHVPTGALPSCMSARWPRRIPPRSGCIRQKKWRLLTPMAVTVGSNAMPVTYPATRTRLPHTTWRWSRPAHAPLTREV
jgi:hypothetical protein